MKYFVQKLTYDDGRVKEIRRDYDEMLDFHQRLERNEIDNVRNLTRKEEAVEEYCKTVSLNQKQTHRLIRKGY